MKWAWDYLFSLFDLRPGGQAVPLVLPVRQMNLLQILAGCLSAST